MCAASAQCTQFLCVPTTLFCGRTPLQRTFDCGASPLALSRLRCIRCIPLAASVFASAVVPHLRVHTQVHALHNMASHTARSKKIVKEKGAEPDEFEESVAQVRLGVGRSSTIRLRTPPLTGNVEMEQALFDLEATNTELKADLRDLYITSAREIDIRDSTRKAIIVHVSGGENSALLRGGKNGNQHRRREG